MHLKFAFVLVVGSEEVVDVMMGAGEGGEGWQCDWG